MKKALLWLVAGTIVYGITLDSVSARPAYKKEFDALYMTDGSELFKALDGKSNCNLCHDGTDKKKRNDYGNAMSKFVAKNEKDAAKIKEALQKTEAEKCTNGTFGDLIKSGKLPVTK